MLFTALSNSVETLNTIRDSKKMNLLAESKILNMKNVLDQSIDSVMSAKDEKDEKLLNAIRCHNHRVRGLQEERGDGTSWRPTWSCSTDYSDCYERNSSENAPCSQRHPPPQFSPFSAGNHFVEIS